MKPALVEDYKNTTYRSLTRSVLSNFLLENKRIPFIVGMDSTIIHFKPWSQIVFNPHVKGGWKAILERYYETDSYKTLNNAVAGDPMLSKYATINFLNALFKKTQEQIRSLPKLKQSDGNPIQNILNAIDSSQISPKEAKDIVNAIVSELEKDARETLRDIETAQSFSHFGVPIAQLLENPDKFREMVRNRIIVNLVKFLHKLRREAPNLKQTKAPTLIGGRPLGVKRLQRWSELTRIIPMEYIDDDLLTYKIASRTVRVSEQYGSIQNYVVYLDKSGSMSGDIKYYVSPTQYEYVPKISFATASALALAFRLRSVGAKMTLKLFDVEVHDPITDFIQLIDVLLKIRADSGTNISKVLEDALKYRDEKIVIVTDGIDRVDEDAVKKAKNANLDITCIFIQTDNELLRKNFPCIHVKEAKPSILLEV